MGSRRAKLEKARRRAEHGMRRAEQAEELHLHSEQQLSECRQELRRKMEEHRLLLRRLELASMVLVVEVSEDQFREVPKITIRCDDLCSPKAAPRAIDMEVPHAGQVEPAEVNERLLCLLRELLDDCACRTPAERLRTRRGARI